jgi:hypothetical protein
MNDKVAIHAGNYRRRLLRRPEKSL